MNFRLAMLAAVLLSGGVALAVDGEFYVNTYRSIGTVATKGLRSAAMGGAGRGLADGAASLGTNPAAMGAHRGYEVDMGLGYDWLDDGEDDVNQFNFRLGGAVNLDCIQPGNGPNQAMGAMLGTTGYSGAAMAEMKREQTSFLVAYGIHLLDDVLAGVSVGLYDGKWKSDPRFDGDLMYLDRKFTGGDFRLSGIYRLSDVTTVGATLGYATGSLRERGGYAADAGSGSIDRWNLGVGVAHQYADETLLLGDLWYDNMKSDIPGAIRERNKSWGLSLGVEQMVIPEMMALRGGLYYDRTSYSASSRVGAGFVGPGGGSHSKGRFGFTAGLGVRVYQFDVGYSLDVNSGGDVKNLLEVSAEW